MEIFFLTKNLSCPIIRMAQIRLGGFSRRKKNHGPTSNDLIVRIRTNCGKRTDPTEPSPRLRVFPYFHIRASHCLPRCISPRVSERRRWEAGQVCPPFFFYFMLISHVLHFMYVRLCLGFRFFFLFSGLVCIGMISYETIHHYKFAF